MEEGAHDASLHRRPRAAPYNRRMPSRRGFLKLPPLALAAGAVGRAAEALGQSAPQPPPRVEPAPPPAQAELPARGRGPWVRATYDTYVRNPLVASNKFLACRRRRGDADLRGARALLPEPFWDGHASAIDCYWTGLGARVRATCAGPSRPSGFVANFIDTAFNDCLFMWDSASSSCSARYGARAFNFQRTLDNLYAKQHPDGFICREIGERTATDRFDRFDPLSTGPNVMAWAEWEYYRNFGDRERLARVFPVLLAYHQWLRAYRTWPDGTTGRRGWGCGMDNQPRCPTGPTRSDASAHGHMTWVDACLQQVLSARLLVRDGTRCSARGGATSPTCARRLARLEPVRQRDACGTSAIAFYYDRSRDGALNGVKTIGAYWALLAGVVPPARLERVRRAPRRPARVQPPAPRAVAVGRPPGLRRRSGGYWRGGVWPPTNYMVLRGPDASVGRDALAHEIAVQPPGQRRRSLRADRHRLGELRARVRRAGRPRQAATSSAGAACRPIAVLLEYVFGLRPDAPARRLLWDVRLTEAHGVSATRSATTSRSTSRARSGVRRTSARGSRLARRRASISRSAGAGGRKRCASALADALSSRRFSLSAISPRTSPSERRRCTASCSVARPSSSSIRRPSRRAERARPAVRLLARHRERWQRSRLMRARLRHNGPVALAGIVFLLSGAARSSTRSPGSGSSRCTAASASTPSR